jgi:serine/threonine-protein kinase
MNKCFPTGYRLIRALGEGGDGTVFLAESTENDLYALKVFHCDCFANQALARELSMRLRSWIDLGSHPCLVGAFSCGFYSNRAVLVMEYVVPDRITNNISLQDYMCHSDGPLNLYLSIRWATQVCCAMEHANGCGVCAHGDIKPSNILITTDKNAKLTDFGCALTSRASKGLFDSTERTEHLLSRRPLLANGGVIRGTPGYISPEVYRGEKADVQSDLFSFGVVLWQLAAGRNAPPFLDRGTSNVDSADRNPMLNRVPRTASPLDPVIQRCLSADPAERFDDFSCLRRELERLIN